MSFRFFLKEHKFSGVQEAESIDNRRLQKIEKYFLKPLKSFESSDIIHNNISIFICDDGKRKTQTVATESQHLVRVDAVPCIFKSSLSRNAEHLF